MVSTWQRQTTRSRWGCNACSSRGRYRSCIVPDPAAAARRCCRRGRPAACIGEGVLSDLVYLFTREHASVLHRVRTLKSVIHFLNYTDISEISHVKTTLLIDTGLPRLETIYLFCLFGKEMLFRVFRVVLGFESFRPRGSVGCE